MRVLNWADFNNCINSITEECNDKKLSGVYGFPRGGLCLAVALSHSLRIPFLSEPLPSSLIVDDVYETGSTLNQVREIPNITAFVWLSKVEPEWWFSVEVTGSTEWIIFPWEDRNFAEVDERNYKLTSRNL